MTARTLGQVLDEARDEIAAIVEREERRADRNFESYERVCALNAKAAKEVDRLRQVMRSKAESMKTLMEGDTSTVDFAYWVGLWEAQLRREAQP